MDLRITEDQIQSLCANVTEQQRAYCAEHLDGADFPERVMRQSSRIPDVAFDASPLSVECLWSVILSYEGTPLPPVQFDA